MARPILKNNQNTHYPRVCFIPKTGIALPKTGVLFLLWRTFRVFFSSCLHRGSVNVVSFLLSARMTLRQCRKDVFIAIVCLDSCYVDIPWARKGGGVSKCRNEYVDEGIFGCTIADKRNGTITKFPLFQTLVTFQPGEVLPRIFTKYR